MTILENQPFWLRYSPLALILASAGALGFAYSAQLVDGLEPCVLCLYQRVPFAVVLVLGLIGQFKPSTLNWVLPLAGAVFLVGCGIAFYHVGVEQQWWQSSCGGDLAGNMSTSDLMAQLQNKPPKACDELEWTLFGISMATYNVAYSLGLAVFCLAGALKLRK